MFILISLRKESLLNLKVIKCKTLHSRKSAIVQKKTLHERFSISQQNVICGWDVLWKM